MTTPARVEDFETGLEDFGVEDAVIPRLAIQHKEGEFKDSLTNETFKSIKVIILGLVKQRVLFHNIVDEGDWPMCRSQNHDTGFPNLSDDQPHDKRFPWDKSGFRKEDYPPGPDGLIRLPCDGCQLKEWGSHPDGKKPYCAEQFTLPILYDPRDEDKWVPAIVTFQKTALKPLKAYLSAFARSKDAAFMAVTQIELEMRKRGSNVYSVPIFSRVGSTDEENWREYSTNYRTMRDFLEADPGTGEEEEEVPAAPSDNKNTGPAESDTEDSDKDIVDAEIVDEAKEGVKAGADDTDSSAEDDDELPF